MPQELIIADKSYLVLTLPGRPKAILDRTVAEIYEVETRAINQAVERNLDKFPSDFMFELTAAETAEVITICDDLKFSPHSAKAYTWEGCNMLATILKSDIATKRAVQIIRAFTKLEAGGYDKTPANPDFLPNLSKALTAAINLALGLGDTIDEARANAVATLIDTHGVDCNKLLHRQPKPPTSATTAIIAPAKTTAATVAIRSPIITTLPPEISNAGYYSAAQIGWRLTPRIYAPDVNRLLEDLRLQLHDHDCGRRNAWLLTDTGCQYGKLVASGKRRYDGRPAQIIKWSGRVIRLLQDHLDEAVS